MKYKIIIILIIIFISGCDSSSSSHDVNEDYRAGTDGIVINYMANAPLSKFYDDETVNVMVEVKNNGATDIELGSNSKVYISGYDDSILGMGTYFQSIGDLEGKTMYSSQGETNVLEYQGQVFDLESKNIDSYNFNLMATACFDYTTIAEPNICLDSDPYSQTSKQKACNAQSNPSLGSQGGPIQVSSVNVEPMKGRTKFKISFKNVGGGTVFKEGYEYLTHCSPYDPTGLEYNDIDYVQLTSVTIANTDIQGTCKPMKDNYVRLTNGAGYVVCEIENLNGPAYTTPLRITLDYGYQVSISKSIEVLATP